MPPPDLSIRKDSLLKPEVQNWPASKREPKSPQWQPNPRIVRGEQTLYEEESQALILECVIFVRAETNPKGGRSTRRFECYRNGQTIAQYIETALAEDDKTSIREAKQDVAWDFNRGFIDVYPPRTLADPTLPLVADTPSQPLIYEEQSGSIADLDGASHQFVDRAATRVSNVYKRDPKIRETVIKEADGCCEVCRRRSFMTSAGTPYLESHHIIALADHGEDALSNVIAVCPEHHREAHFGQLADDLEKKMMKIVEKREAERGHRAMS